MNDATTVIYWDNVSDAELNQLTQLLSRLGLYDESQFTRTCTIRGLVNGVNSELDRRHVTKGRDELNIIANALTGIGGTDARMAVLAKAILRLEDKIHD